MNRIKLILIFLFFPIILLAQIDIGINSAFGISKILANKGQNKSYDFKPNSSYELGILVSYKLDSSRVGIRSGILYGQFRDKRLGVIRLVNDPNPSPGSLVITSLESTLSTQMNVISIPISFLLHYNKFNVEIGSQIFFNLKEGFIDETRAEGYYVGGESYKSRTEQTGNDLGYNKTNHAVFIRLNYFILKNVECNLKFMHSTNNVLDQNIWPNGFWLRYQQLTGGLTYYFPNIF